MSAPKRPPANGRRRILRYAAGALAALALIQGVRLWEGGRREVTVRYAAPPGPLRVELRDADGALVRRVEFAAGTLREHPVRLPDGAYVAQLSLPTRAPVVRAFAVDGGGAIELRW